MKLVNTIGIVALALADGAQLDTLASATATISAAESGFTIQVKKEFL